MKSPLRVNRPARAFICAGLLLLTLGLSGCGQKSSAGKASAAPSSANGAEQGAHAHEHVAPNGGTPVVLGDEAFHLEFLLDTKTGKLQAFVLDGEMENFIRISAPSLDLTITALGQSHDLALKPAANIATGETEKNTSLFEAQADWLKGVASFDAVVKQINLRGALFQDVSFNYPKGNEAR